MVGEEGEGGVGEERGDKGEGRMRESERGKRGTGIAREMKEGIKNEGRRMGIG